MPTVTGLNDVFVFGRRHEPYAGKTVTLRANVGDDKRLDDDDDSNGTMMIR